MLKTRIYLPLMVIALMALAIFAQASSSPGVTSEDLKQIMPLSQVRPGMKGYGLTVFKGTKIEKFDVEVLGILRKANNGKDLIFVKVSGGPVTERSANIMQGMSGSPVYVNGKIIGALSMVPGGFAREPLCMLTPIEDMLEALDPNLPERPVGLSSNISTLNQPIQVNGKTITGVEIRRSTSNEPAPEGTLVMTPLMTPLMVSGVNSSGISELSELLQPYGLQPMAGPGAKADAVPAELVPGAAVGVSLVTGDVDLTGVGTVTYRRGNKLVAFGHPLLEIGPVDLPMTTAYVLDVFPSYEISFKMASPMQEVGRIFEDRPWSIGGEIGGCASMIPVNIEVNNKFLNRKTTKQLKVLNHPLLGPRLIVMMAGQAVSQVHGIPGDAMAKVNVTIEADQIGKIERENVYFSRSGIEGASLNDLQELIGILTSNKFYPLDIESVHMNIEIESGRRTASIERIFVDKSKYEPGETINVGIELRPYKSDKIIKTMQIIIPENTPDGKVTLRVTGGMVGGEETPVMIVPGEGDGPRVTPLPGGTAENIQQLLDKYLEQEKNNELIVRLLFSSGAVTISGEKLSNLPEPIANVMKTTRATGLKMEREEVKVSEPTDYILTGGQSLPIEVARRYRAVRNEQPEAPSHTEQQESVEEDSETSSDEPVIEPDEGVVEESRLIYQFPFGRGSSGTLKRIMPPTPAPDEEQSSTASKEADKPEAKPEQKTDKKPDDQSGEKPVTRQPTVWVQKEQKDFAAGTFDHTAATDADDVRIVPAINKVSSLPEDYVWRVIPDGKGGVFAGTGNRGIVYRISPDGTASSVFFETKELEVHSLAMDSKGNLYAGTSPNGRVYKISPDGTGGIIFNASAKYILALAVDSRDNIYAAAGDDGSIYRISPEGKAVEFAKIPKPSVLALAVDSSDNVYVGAGKDGLVFKITPDGAMSVIYDAEEDSISSLVVDNEGNVYAGTGTGKGMIYRIPAVGQAKPVFDKAPRALSLAADAQGGVYTVSDEHIYKVLPDETVVALDTDRQAVQFIAIAVNNDGSVWAGTANTAAVYRLTNTPSGFYESPVRDAGRPSRWGRISWIADTPDGASVSIQTRSGNSAQPDNTWSEWSSEYTLSSGQAIQSPPARYIQYRAALRGSGSDYPVLKQVTTAYLTENQRPTITINAPQPGGIVARTYEVKWAGEDPDKDALNYDLYYSADNGATWQALGSGLKQAKNDKPTPEPKKEEPKGPMPPGMGVNIQISGEGPPDVDQMIEELKAELEKHPEIPQEIKDRMLAEAPAALREAIASSGQPPKPDQPPKQQAQPEGEKKTTKETSYKWDTTSVPDGLYMFKVVASDRASNAEGFLTEEKTVGPIIVANKPPSVTAFKKELVINPDRTVKLTGYAYHTLVPVVGVQYKTDSEDWMSAAATDGIFDSISEPFIVTTTPLKPGDHNIEIKAIDAAGNAGSTKITVQIPEDKEASEEEADSDEQAS